MGDLPHYIPYIPPLTTTFCLSLSSFTIRRFFLSNEASFFVFPTFSATARSQEPITLTVFSVAMTLTAVGVLLTGLYYKRMMDAKYFGKSGNNDNLKQDRFRQRPWSKSARVRTIQRQLTIEDESFKTPLGQRKSRLRIGYNHRSKQRSKPWWSIAYSKKISNLIEVLSWICFVSCIGFSIFFFENYLILHHIFALTFLVAVVFQAFTMMAIDLNSFKLSPLSKIFRFIGFASVMLSICLISFAFYYFFNSNDILEEIKHIILWNWLAVAEWFVIVGGLLCYATFYESLKHLSVIYFSINAHQTFYTIKSRY
eukprot:gnl/Carplike_NY0171/5947_a8144_279.p1 GENE.gnl/Carplike_NY0171/5947_a8144_279~~gnl/Carplike_NY0171/5947_a8144_279.p1  ORF type:complete len:312 (+),score=26.67 gnl/Carplike_NY0171/5947_a8144_279:589-1524(+)